MPPEMDYSRRPPNRETRGTMEINRLVITDRSVKSCYLAIEGKVLPSKFPIGWVTSITICLKYDDFVIGYVTVPDMPLILDDENRFKTDWYETKNPEMEIENMRSFSDFLQDLMPQKDKNTQSGFQRRIFALTHVSNNGHALTVTINLSNLVKMKTTVSRLIIDECFISITIVITNESPLEIPFEYCTLSLKQNQHTIGTLSGDLTIVPGSFEVKLRGKIQRGASGMAALKGDIYESCDCEHSWKQYAIKLFEAEVNLDKMNDGDTDIDDLVVDCDA